jgi:UDP-N-acetylglucosamine 4,6-dehydratase
MTTLDPRPFPPANAGRANVLITGGAGFLGRAILDRIQRAGWSWSVTVYSRDETKQDQARRRYPWARFVLGDITDTPRLAAAMSGHDVVLHAAAVKYIPDAEANPGECVRVNVGGAQSVIDAARRAGVGLVVGISTDKAVGPINVYGQTKAIMERLFAEAARLTPDVRFQTVRYGNVVGSTGSVIPLFQQQLRKSGRLTLTDPDMTRFWMSPDAAIDTILAAMAPGRVPGSTTIPIPQAMTMGALAAALAPDGAIDVIGIRPGEKLHESLIDAAEPAYLVDGPADYSTEATPGYYEIIGKPFAPDGRVLERLASALPTLSSADPSGGWVSVEQLRRWILEAERV